MLLQVLDPSLELYDLALQGSDGVIPALDLTLQLRHCLGEGLDGIGQLFCKWVQMCFKLILMVEMARDVWHLYFQVQGVKDMLKGMGSI